MNEGHAALLTVALLEQQLHAAIAVKARPTRILTPSVSAASLLRTRRFPPGTTASPWSRPSHPGSRTHAHLLERIGACHDGCLNMTYLALNFSRYVNGVAMQHGNVSREMFPECADRGHHQRRACCDLDGRRSCTAAFDQHLPRWRQDNFHLRYAIDIPAGEIEDAHLRVKERADREM